MVIYASAVTLEWSANNKRCWPTPKFQHRLESPLGTQLSPWLIILWRVAGLITPWFFGTFFLNLSFVIVSLNWISTSHCWFVKVVLSTRPTPSCCQKIATWLQSQTFWTDRFMSQSSPIENSIPITIYKSISISLWTKWRGKGSCFTKVSILLPSHFWCESHRNSNPIWKSITPKNRRASFSTKILEGNLSERFRSKLQECFGFF